MSFDIWGVTIHQVCDSQGGGTMHTEHNSLRKREESELSLGDKHEEYRAICLH
jgi:hypothetical protein